MDINMISHPRGDHFGGLPFFIMESQYASGCEKPLILAGPPGLEARAYEAMEVLYPGSCDAPLAFALMFLKPARKRHCRNRSHHGAP